MKVQELLGQIKANRHIIAIAKEQMDICEKQIADILNNTEEKYENDKRKD